MVNLSELLKGDVSGFFKQPSNKAPTTGTETTEKFTSLETSGRIIRSYRGVLPCARGKARHILRCEHLRQIPGEGLPPYRARPEYTHQLWLWYRLNEEPDKLYLLFRGQFDFSLSEREPDWVAGKVSDFLAFLLIYTDKCKSQREVFRHQHSDRFWLLAIEKKLQRLASG